MPDPSPESSLFSRRLRHVQLLWLDALAALGYVLLLLNFAAIDPPASAVGWPLTIALAIAIGTPLAFRRRWPVPVFTWVLAATIAGMIADLPPDSFVAAAFALYTVALTVTAPGWLSTTTVGVISFGGLLLISLSGPVDSAGTSVTMLLLGMVVMGGSWTIGRALRDRRASAERAAERLADQRVAEERLHIARELHDVVAHSMSLIAVKASVANHVAKKRPSEAFHALEVIESTSKTTLAEMRQILGVLRSDSTAPAQLAPTPGLADLPLVVDRAALAGVTVKTTVPQALELPTGVDLSAYRIIQEAVTNVVKHAAPARCEVSVTAANGHLEITVRDDGPGERVLPANPLGHGLRGMAERVAVFDGRFKAGPRPGGGFTVNAVIPFESEKAIEAAV